MMQQWCNDCDKLLDRCECVAVIEREIKKDLEKERYMPEEKQCLHVDCVIGDKSGNTHCTLLETVKLAYRKHHMNDDSIGWEELADTLHNALCNAMGDLEFQRWVDKL